MIDSNDRQLLFNQIPMAVSLSLESDGLYVDVNAEWTRLTGMSAQQVLGRNSVDVGMWPSVAQRSEALAALRDTGELRDLHLTLDRHGHAPLVLQVNVVRLELRGVRYLLSYLKDVTDAQAAQVALRASEQLLLVTNARLKQQLAMFEAMESLASVGYWTSADDQQRLVWSKGLYQLAGLPPGSVQTSTDAQSRIHPDDLPAFAQAQHVLDGQILEYRWQHPDGSLHWHRTRIQRLNDDSFGASAQAFGMVQDITREREVALDLRDKLGFIQKITSRFRALTELSSDWYWEQDEQFRFVQVAGNLEALNVLPRGNYVGKTRWNSGVEGVSPSQWDAHRAALAAHEVFHDFEMQRLRPDGSLMWAAISGAPMFDAAGKFTGYQGIGRDITERKLAEEKIERLAFYDALTGLPNRRLLTERLHVALLGAARHDQCGAVLFIDLDNFKDLNDTMGHDVGDMLLCQVAARLQSSVREVDTVARLGGDEFVVVLEDLGSDIEAVTARVEQVGRKILAKLNQVYLLGMQEHHSTPSLGVALLCKQVESVEELLKRADLAMYESKAAGRNTMRFFDPAMQAMVAQRTAVERDLRLALERSEWVLHYQPVVDRHGVVVGVEALVRWQHPKRGLLAPGEFIAQAEHTGLIVPLGQWVLRTACEQLVSWRGQPDTAGLTMAVNVSARQFRHPDFVDQVLHVLRSTGADPHLLKLEITESLLVIDMPDVIDKMQNLRDAHVSFALDDFGTGYSSLSYLKRLPLDQLKIDQSFVRDVLADLSDAAIANMVLTLGQSLNLRVVAEGVEERGQFEFLLQSGCAFFQGYLFSKPVPIEQLRLGRLAPPPD
ncbi:MAG: EAL domain-containing protein [Rhodoferax sp.]|uniref:sensor domain-containing protein n=1 Tax=Rhodoferax sp. TaxID=50421 RepID=UPI002636D826|nr:EAL domain-containing protein [Rhodoferax sp.]MDD2878831.1 EAL domain-containing protein [Rhodoferax sp.]